MNWNHIHQQNSIRQIFKLINTYIYIYSMCKYMHIFSTAILYGWNIANRMWYGWNIANTVWYGWNIANTMKNTKSVKSMYSTVHHNPPESLLGQLVQSVPQALPKEQQHVALE